MKKAAETPDDWIPKDRPKAPGAPDGKRAKASNRDKAATSPPKRQPRQPPARKANSERPSANTEEWLAVSKDVTKEKPSSSNRATAAKGAAERRPPRRGSGLGAALSQMRRLSSGLRSVRRDLVGQQGEIARLEKQLNEGGKREQTAQKRLAENLAQLETKVTAQAKAERDQAAAVERIEKKLDAKLAALGEQDEKRNPKAAQKASTDAKTEIASEVAAIERRLKKREQTTRRQAAEAVEQLEQKLAETTEQLERAEAAAEAHAEPTPARAKSRGPKPVELPKGKLDVNELSFEEFRALGLSVTQSSRLIALRDMNDGFSEIDNLDRVVGLPRELRRDLKRRLVVRG